MIQPSGNLGIGRTPATNKLEVEGNASKTTAGDWLANSDIRIKTDIQDLENSLDIINALRPVKFRYTDEYRAGEQSSTETLTTSSEIQSEPEPQPEPVPENSPEITSDNVTNLQE